MKRVVPGPSNRHIMARLKKPELLAEALKVSLRPDVVAFVARANDLGFSWDDCRHRAFDLGLAPEVLWQCVKFSRLSDRMETPVRDLQDRPFTLRLPPAAQRALHDVDRFLGGYLGQELGPRFDTEPERQRWLQTSLQEEALTSSLIEGAVVAREAAREMLRVGRQPRDLGERMVLNNFRTIRWLNEHRHEPLTVGMLTEIQAQLTDQTLAKPDAVGRLRRPSEEIQIVDEEESDVVHIPPSARVLKKRLEALCRFANGTDNDPAFIHPAVRAIILHFWLAYDHPFCDGNGRTARALFYWSMLRQGYWLAEYLSISSVIRERHRQYYRAFEHSEKDDNDLTYFVLFHLRVITESIDQFRRYVERKQSERLQALPPALILQLNHRQQALLTKARNEPATVFTYTSHAGSHGITLATARTDILELEQLGYLVANRKGRRFTFHAAPDLDRRLERP
ncbi:MAG TPA: Fic family protein [Gemmatales bacterium]|nr:Fic family protein [Gemmatales bacterium]HMP60652.1 Fic family protein [Gemmatales bacterium]